MALLSGHTPVYPISGLCTLLVLVSCVLKGLQKLWQRREHLAATLRKLPQNRCPKRECTGTEMFLRSEVSKLQLEFARSFLGIAAAVLCVALVGGQARLRSGIPDSEFIASTVVLWNQLVLGVLIAGALWVPCAVTVRTLDLWNLIFNLHIVVFLSPAAFPTWGVFSGRVFSLVVIQLPCMIFVQSRILAGVCYLFIAVFTIVRFLSADPELTSTTMLGRRASIFGAEFILFPFVFTLVSFVHKMFRQKVEARVRESDAASQLDAVSALLRLTCDAVIELDNELRLIDQCPKLAGILLRRASLQGVCFTDLISRAEAQRARENLLGNGGAGPCSFATAFHTHLVDSCSSKFRTEVFQVKYRMSNNELRHLIGLRDFTDVKSLAGCKATDAIDDEVHLDQFESCTLGLSTHEGPASIVQGLDDRHDSPSCSSSQSASSYALVESEVGELPGCAEKFEEPREIVEHGVVEQVIQLKKKNIFLELDMRAMQISAASAPVTALVGRPLWEVFMCEYTVELCNRLLRQARQVPFLPDTAVSFERMPIFCAPRTIEATGSMHVVQTSCDLRVILIFRPVERIQL
ncbi:unnamed protein product [Effrenium voratum]|uniref:Uncharacterized protein n=2 Tax=Effrenium voratum TaxID=2562239 RepID=A0AA36I8R7_9DINO|nr:unnamed protein product [Effrenium voratum]